MIGKWCVRLILVSAAVAFVLSACQSTPDTPVPTTPSPQPVPMMSPVRPTSVATPSLIDPDVVEALKHIVRMEGAVLARVNGDEITWEDFEPSLRQTLVSISKKSNVDWSDAAMQARLGFVQNDVLKQLVDRWLLRQMAADQGVTVAETDVDAAAEQEKAGQLKSGRFPDWDTFLDTYGLTDKSYRLLISDRLLFSALVAKQSVEAEAEQVHIRHIVVSDDATAQTVLGQLKSGADFAALAAQYSLDEQTKDAGGDLGWATEDSLLPEIAPVVASLAPGQFSGPIPTQAGVAIIQLVERGMHALDASLLLQKQQQAVTAQLEAVRATATIEYLVDFTKVGTPSP